MDWMTVNEQRQNALRRVFYMLIFMALLIVRAGVDARGLSTPYPPESEPLPDEAPSAEDRLALSALYRAACALICAANAVLRRLEGMTREIYERMNEAHALALSGRGRACEAIQLRGWPRERLDSS